MIFICGNARAGKDTLFLVLSEILKDNVVCERFALADELKCIVSPFTKQHFNISAFTKDPDEKELRRPILVEVAEVFRKLSKGAHWTSLLQPKIEESIKNGNLPIVTDGRFCEYPDDELWWAKRNGGAVVYVSRFYPDCTIVGPANQKEIENNKKLIDNADFCVNWPTSDNFQYLCDIVKVQLKDLINILCLKYPKKQTTN